MTTDATAAGAVAEVRGKGGLLALIIRSSFDCEGIRFFTPDEFSQQLGYMHHPAGTKIKAHAHTPLPREVSVTQEVLFIRRGRLRADFYDDDHAYVSSAELGPGDVILLASGGHGFEVLEELEMFEVKQGPYAGPQEKRWFETAGPPPGKTADAEPGAGL